MSDLSRRERRRKARIIITVEQSAGGAGWQATLRTEGCAQDVLYVDGPAELHSIFHGVQQIARGAERYTFERYCGAHGKPKVGGPE